VEPSRRLVDASTLTSAQVESLSSHLRVLAREMTLKQAASARSVGPVRIGSYFRTVQQGRSNIKSSIMTVVLALLSGFVKGEELRRLLNQVGEGFPELGEDEIDRAVSLIEALVDKIVM